MLTDRRRHERFSLRPMYTGIALRGPLEEGFPHEGHAYDISESGLRFELDRSIEPGTQVELKISLPGGGSDASREIMASATIVWLADEEEPGPAQMAAVFRRFACEEDHDRLVRHLASGKFGRAA